MATHISHAGLPYPVKNARYTVPVPWLDADGDPTDATSPDSERSIDGASFADCTEEATVVTGSNGCGYLTLTGAETDASLVWVACKGTGPKTTLLAVQPRVLPVLASGTAQGGANGSVTLASGASAVDDYYVGCIVVTTGGTGGGGTGGADNQARVITDYNGTTKVASVAPNWETNPANDTTYEVRLTESSLAAVSGVPVPASVSDKTGYSLSSAGVDAVLDEAVEGSVTLRQALRVVLAFLAGKATGGGTTEIVFRDVNDTTDRVTLTVDAVGDRSAVTLSVA